MQYMGGKSRIARNIAEIINKYNGETFVSLFCGSCAVEKLINIDKKILNDKHQYLIAMWRDLQNGRELPDSISEKEYYELRHNKDIDRGLTGFVGFACSFGGKWFEGFARGANRNFCLTGKKHTMKNFDNIKNAKFTCFDYKDVEIPPNSIIYCDPPYSGTTGYSTIKNFNHDEFWKYMRVLSKDHIVFISEQTAPDDFECIWSKNVKRTIDTGKGLCRVEKLFIYKKS